MLGFKIHDENEAVSIFPKKHGRGLGKSINNVHFSEPFVSSEDTLNKAPANKIKVVKSGRKALSNLSGSQVNTRLTVGPSTTKKTNDFTKDPSSLSTVPSSTSASIFIANEFAPSTEPSENLSCNTITTVSFLSITTVSFVKTYCSL